MADLLDYELGDRSLCMVKYVIISLQFQVINTGSGSTFHSLPMYTYLPG